jgi:hypothetical protein
MPRECTGYGELLAVIRVETHRSKTGDIWMRLILPSFIRRQTGRQGALPSVSSREPDNPKEQNIKAGELPTEFAGLFRCILDEWDHAEEVIKLAEQVTAHAVIPSIQELRYAGRRVVDALHRHMEGKPAEEARALLEDARFSCHRARHDAIDAAISVMSIDADALAKQMGYDVVHNSFPDFVNFLGRLDAVRQSIVASRGKRSSRDEIYSAITTSDFPGLVQDYKDLRRSETAMRIIVSRKKLGLWLSIIAGVLIAIPGYIMGWYFWRYPIPTEPVKVEIVQPPKNQLSRPVGKDGVKPDKRLPYAGETSKP